MTTTSRLALIGAPSDAGAGTRGACLGPAALRIAGLGEALAGLGHEVVDCGDVVPRASVPLPHSSSPPRREPRCRNAGAVAAWCRAVGGAVAGALADGALPVLLGGDHSLAAGSIAAVAAHCRAAGRPLSVLWLDAHTDFNTPETSPTGNLHGMPVAALTGHMPGAAFGLDGDAPLVAPSRVHLLGVRSVDRVEKARVVASGLDVLDMRTIDERGIVAVLRTVLDGVARAGGHLHVSLDLDVLDPALAPGVGTPVPGGATYREAHLCMEMIHESGLLGSLDLVELDPFRDVRGKSARLLVDLAGSLFGRQIVARRPAAHRAA